MTLFSMAALDFEAESTDMMKLKSPKVFELLVLAVISVGIGLVVMMVRTFPESSVGKSAGKDASPSSVDTNPEKSFPVGNLSPRNLPGNLAPGGTGGIPDSLPAGTMPPLNTVYPEQWDARLEELLVNQDISNRDASRELLAMAANAEGGTEQQRIDAVQHGLNLLEDDFYLQDALVLASTPDLPEEMNAILFADLHNRSPEVSVPVADKIAKTPGHPLAEEAKDFVDFFKDARETTPALK